VSGAKSFSAAASPPLHAVAARCDRKTRQVTLAGFSCDLTMPGSTHRPSWAENFNFVRVLTEILLQIGKSRV
jgi:hypothetical protein